jgi:hypothetical protein
MPSQGCTSGSEWHAGGWRRSPFPTLPPRSTAMHFPCPWRTREPSFTHPARPLRAVRSLNSRRRQHRPADFLDVFVRDAFVKKVAHRVHENHLRLGPADRVPKLLGYEPQIESKFEWMAGHTAKPFRERLGVAMRAAGANLRAASHRIPRCIRPLDFGIVTHAQSSFWADHSVAGWTNAGYPSSSICR